MTKKELVKILDNLFDDCIIEIGIFDEYGDEIDFENRREIKNGVWDVEDYTYVIG